MVSDVFTQKQEWLKKVMASDLPPATKVFAWGIFSRMYGVKVVSNPGKETISEDTNLAKSKYGAHRKALFSAKAMTGVLTKTENGDWDNYEYTLNLEWDGSISTADRGVSLEVLPGGVSLEVPGVVPTGNQGVSLRDTQVVPTGVPNTTRKITKKKTSKKTTGRTAEAAVRSQRESTVREEDEFSSLLSFNGYPSLKNIKSSEVTFEEGSVAVADAPVYRGFSPKSKKQDRVFDKTKEGYAWLETLLTRNRVTTARSEVARDLFFDETWKPEKTGDARAAAAESYAEEPKVAAGSW